MCFYSISASFEHSLVGAEKLLLFFFCVNCENCFDENGKVLRQVLSMFGNCWKVFGYTHIDVTIKIDYS